MRNITEGFHDFNNITVYRADVVDGVRFMITSEGIDICDADVDRYFLPCTPTDCFIYQIGDTDIKVPHLTSSDRASIRKYVQACRGACNEEWVKAANHL